MIINEGVNLLDNEKGFNNIVDFIFQDYITYFVIIFVAISGSVGNCFINTLYEKLFDIPIKILENETFKKGLFYLLF